MQDADSLRKQAERCLALRRNAKRADVREALAALAQDYATEARAFEARTARDPRDGVADQRNRRANVIICPCAVLFVWWIVAARANMAAFRNATMALEFSER